MVTQLNHFGWKFVGNHIEAYYHSKSLRVSIFWYELSKRKLFFQTFKNRNCRIFPPINPPGCLDFLPRQGPTLPANMPPEVQQILTDQEYQAACFFPVTRMLWDKAFTGGLRLQPILHNKSMIGYMKVKSGRPNFWKLQIKNMPWEMDSREATKMEFDRLMEATVLPKKTMFLGIFRECPLVQRWLKWWFKIVAFFFGSCYIRPFSPFFFPAKKLHILIEMPEVCTYFLSHLCACGDWRSDCASVHAGQIGNKGPMFTIWRI